MKFEVVSNRYADINHRCLLHNSNRIVPVAHTHPGMKTGGCMDRLQAGVNFQRSMESMIPFVTGTIKRIDDFPSRFVEARTVDIWTPPTYDESAKIGYPVIYMHDGQNLFCSETSFIGIDWGIDAAMCRLISEGTIKAALVVGIWNTPLRMREYTPQRQLESQAAGAMMARCIDEHGGKPLSDNYLNFIIDEVKPFVDEHYHTATDRKHTFIMGSSMGALVSLYALCEYPSIFGGAGCLSTHWPAVDTAILEYLKEMIPDPAHHRIYFDYGTETLDMMYESFQKQVDTIMQSAGYGRDETWITRKYPGADHSERAWRERVHVPLRFFLSTGLS